MGIKILLADDSVTAQNMGKKILSEAGHDVVTVSNGAAAAKKIAEIKPDLVLLDVFMPGYSGLELCEKLRNGADTSKLPVLLTVGRMEPYSAQDGARVKADGIIIKPFEATDLTAAVERLASKGKSSPKTLAWKSDSKTEETAAAPESKANDKPKTHDETIRLDPAEIAKMLASKPVPPPAPAATNSDLIDPSAEEFNVTPLDRREAIPVHTATPAFAEDLPSTPPPPKVNAAMVPAFAMEEVAPVAAPQQSAAAAPEAFAVQTFEVETAEVDVKPAEGLELTAAAPVPEMSIASEAALEPTLQSATPDTVISKDPALETNPHRSATEFPTQFGTAEAEAQPVTAMHHVTVTDSVIDSSDATLSSALSSYAPEAPQPAPPDEFEARLKAAMSAYDEPAPHAEIAVVQEPQAMATNEYEITIDAAPSFPVMPEMASGVDEGHSSVTPFSSEMHAEDKPNAAPSFGSLPELVADDEQAYTTESNREFTPLAIDDTESQAGLSSSSRDDNKHQEKKEESIAEAADSFLKAVSAAQVTPTHETHNSGIALVPDSDDAVIQQMRDSLSELPMDHHAGGETHVQPAPMAMAAAASFAPNGRDAEIDITQALADSMKAVEGNIPISAGQKENGDAHHVASAVDHVLQRELPSLVSKIMAELDLRKNRS